jgi:hypothetical protein
VDENIASDYLTDSPATSFDRPGVYALENNRMLPQQAVSTVASVDDIETHIQKMESIYSKKFLRAIDLPVRDRKQAMRELSYMGITAGSLFPGLDGTCEELAERNFEF